ncbi:MAG: ribosome silencing factor [Acidimicrobiales bacterium]
MTKRSPALAAVAARAAAAKKGGSTTVLDVAPVLVITDTFVITSGSNARQVRTIAEEVEAAVKRAGGDGPRRIEGLDDARWVLLDYGDFVVHVFVEEARAYYDLERLWADVARLEWGEDGKAGPGVGAGAARERAALGSVVGGRR